MAENTQKTRPSRYRIHSKEAFGHFNSGNKIENILLTYEDEYTHTSIFLDETTLQPRHGIEEFFRHRMTNYLRHRGYDVSGLYPAKDDVEGRQQADAKWEKIYKHPTLQPTSLYLLNSYLRWEWAYRGEHGSNNMPSIESFNHQYLDPSLDSIARVLELEPSPNIPRDKAPHKIVDRPERPIRTLGGYDYTGKPVIEPPANERYSQTIFGALEELGYDVGNTNKHAELLAPFIEKHDITQLAKDVTTPVIDGGEAALRKRKLDKKLHSLAEDMQLNNKETGKPLNNRVVDASVIASKIAERKKATDHGPAS